MRIGHIATTQTITCSPDESIQGAALLMRQHHVGDLVVVAGEGGEQLPVGILTDRDIVVSVIALGLDPASLEVGDVMTDDLLTVDESDDVYETIERMRARGIRRVPVVSHDGALAGIVSADDLLAFLSEEMGELSRIASHQQNHEKHAKH
jgi:CBS domain-containing protein